MQGRRDVRGEEVAVKKFNMTFKKNLCQLESVQQNCMPRMEDKQGLSGARQGRGEGCTPGLWPLCFLLCPSFCGGFVFL